MKTELLYNIFEKHPIVTTDSRDCPKDSIFVALKGETFNGNKFAASALEKGCAYAVVDEAEYAPEGDSRFILVDDCLTALQQLARHHRRTLGTRIIGVTGTNGKTTTKELIAAVLGEKYNVLFTQGNLNNHIGVPKTLLRLTKEHDIAVVEMGASHPGEIKTLVNIVEPDCGIITNVGKAHLQGFGSFEGVVRTKGELYDFLRTKEGSVVFIDNGNEHLNGIAQGLKLVTYGTTGEPSLCAGGEVLACDPMLRFRWRHGAGEWHEVKTHLIGSYNILNMLAAASIGLYFGVEPEKIDHALANFRDMEVTPKMVILGDMRELGECSQQEHQRVVDFLVNNGIGNAWLVGEEFGKIDCNFRKFHDVEEVKAVLGNECPEGLYILIKGSNGIRLFELPEML